VGTTLQTSNSITSVEKWATADKAYAKGQQAYIEFGQALAKINATQQEIAERYDMQQAGVAKLLAVGADTRIIRITNKFLPKSTETLYLLTTLNDDAFEELAKPDTTQAKVLEYKRRLAGPSITTTKLVPTSTHVVSVSTAQPTDWKAPLPKMRPPCPGTEGTAPGQYDWSEIRGWVRMSDIPVPTKPFIQEMSVATAERVLGIYPMTQGVLQAIFRYQASLNHPDKGGTNEDMSELNIAYERLQREYF
jgi:hypothetical protein